MSFIVLLKFFHFLSPLSAGGLSFANNLLVKKRLNVKEKFPLVFQALIINLAQIRLVVLVLLWVNESGLVNKLISARCHYKSVLQSGKLF